MEYSKERRLGQIEAHLTIMTNLCTTLELALRHAGLDASALTIQEMERRLRQMRKTTQARLGSEAER